MAKKASPPKNAAKAAKTTQADAASKERTKTLMNWFIVILMLGSVGIALVANPTGQKPTDQPEAPALNQSPTIIPYTANDVNATVEEIFGAMVVLGNTTQPDIAKIDDQLQHIEGVSRVNSRFKELKDASQGAQKLSYSAEVIYDQAIAPAEMLKRIEQSATYLSEVIVYPVGLVSLPNAIHLVNEDLNLSKDFLPKDKMTQAFLNVETRRGDSIKINLQANLAGDNVQQIIAYESLNPRNAPQLLELQGTYQVAALSKNVAVLGQFPYSSKVPDVNALQKEGLDVEAVVTDQIDFTNPPLVLQVQSTADLKPKAVDLNQLLSQVTGVSRVRLPDSGQAALLDFQSTVNYDDLKKDVLNVFLSAGFQKEALTLVDPSVRVTGVFDTSTDQLTEIAPKVQALFKKYGISVDAYQPANIKADKLVDPATGNEYTIAEAGFQALVKPTHQAGDQVSLGIQFLGKRDQAQSIKAIEGQPGSKQTIPFSKGPSAGPSPKPGN